MKVTLTYLSKNSYLCLLLLAFTDICYSTSILPPGLAVDSSGNVYVADFNFHRIRKITPTGTVTTLAGSGSIGTTDAVGTSARFYRPVDVTVDSSGNVYVADLGNNKIRKITPSGSVSTLAGSGRAGFKDAIGTSAQFNNPSGIAVDSDGDVYVADYNNRRIRKISSDGNVTTLAGSGTAGTTDAVGTRAEFRGPMGIAVDKSKNVYVADFLNNKIRKISGDQNVSTLAGNGVRGLKDGMGTIANFAGPYGIAADSNGNIYVADQLIRKISSDGFVSTLISTATTYYRVALDPSEQNLYAKNYNFLIDKFAISPLICPSGTFNVSAQCVDCDPRANSANLISPICTACPAGTFASNSGSSACTNCTAGTYCPLTGMTKATLCPSNKYCPQEGLIRPIDCPLNSFTNPQLGSTSLDNCLCNAGFFKDGSRCTKCPAGYYCPPNSLSSANTAIKCPQNMTSGIGATSCRCIEGYIRSPDDNSKCIACYEGYYCPFANDTAIKCSDNYFCLGGAKMQCPNGTFLENGECKFCEVGKASFDHKTCIDCPTGYYRLSKDWPSCLKCPEGSICTNIDIISCQGGYGLPNGYEDQGCSQCSNCPDGFFCSEYESTNCDGRFQAYETNRGWMI